MSEVFDVNENSNVSINNLNRAVSKMSQVSENCHKISVDNVNQAIDHVLKNCRSKNNIIDNTEPIFLQVNFCVIPDVNKKILRFPLPHSLLTETSTVCLFVPDLVRGRRVHHEPTINHYKNLLRKRGVEGITQVMSSRQVRVEYSQYEEKRKLCNMFDYFLIAEKISSFLIPKLGKDFQRSRKWPVPVKLKHKDLKHEIASKLSKTSMSYSSKGNSNVIQVGHSNMPSLHIAENIIAVCSTFDEFFHPWGWKNIRSLFVKGTKSPPIPLFMSLNVITDFPVEDKNGKKRKEAVTDELSTIGKKVTVYPSGKVVIHEKKRNKTDTDGAR